MKEDILNNLDKYDKDKKQLSYEQDIIELLKKKHSLIKYVHPAIVFKNSTEILNILGDSKRYLQYIPDNVIKKHQDLIFSFCKYNPELLSYVDYKTQLKNVSDVIVMVRKFPLNYDYIDQSIKEDNKELFIYVFDKLFKVKDSNIIDVYYKFSLNSNSLLHNMNPVLLNKDLVMVLGGSVGRIINYKEMVNKIEELSKDKYRFKIFIDLLRLYPNDGYIERVIDRLIDLVSKDYYFYKKNGNIISYNKDLFTTLYKDSLSINEIKELYYILSNDLIHINSRDEFYHFTEIRNKYLSEMNDESIKETKNIIYEYNYAMNYEEINTLIEKYSSSIDYLISKYKKYRYNIDEIEEYETLLIFREMLTINNCYDFEKLKELQEEAYINQKEIRSYDIRINIEDRIRRIYYKEYERVINKKLSYISDEKVLYESLISKNKQSSELIGKSVNIKKINSEDFFDILVRKDRDNHKYYNKYESVSNEFFNLDKEDYYLRVGNITDKVVNIEMNKYYLPGKKYNRVLLEDEKVTSILYFNEKLNERIVRRAIELNVPIEIINIKDVNKNISDLRNIILNKILHYIDTDVEYEEDDRIAKYTPIDCIEIFFNVSNSMVISNNLNREVFTKNIKSIISRIDKIEDNYIRISQMLIVLRNSLESIDNTYDKKVIYRELDKLYRKYNLYIKEESDYRDILLVLESNTANEIKLFNKYNKNQIEYSEVVGDVDFEQIADYLDVLVDNYYRGDIKRIIRISVLSNILANMIDKSLVKLCLLTSVFSDIGRLTDVRFGDYSASIFRTIYKNVLKKEDIDLVCAAIDYQDSVENIEKIKYKYKLKDVEKFVKVSSILKDSLYLDEFKNKKFLVNKEATRLLKIKDVIINNIYDYNIEVLIRKNIISKNYYTNLLDMGYKYEDIDKICKRL